MFIKKITKDSKKLKELEIINQNPIYMCISWCSKICWFPVKKCWFQQNSRDVSRDLYIFWIFKKPTPHPWAAPKTPILNRVEIKVLWNKGYYIIYYVCDVTNKILSHDSNCIMDVVIWPKFGNCSIYIWEVIITPIL